METCPKTLQTLSHTNLIPNYTVKALISNWCESNSIPLPEPAKLTTCTPYQSQTFQIGPRKIESDNDMHSCLSEQVNVDDTLGNILASQYISSHFSIPREDHVSKKRHIEFSSEVSEEQGNSRTRSGSLIEIGHEL